MNPARSLLVLFLATGAVPAADTTDLSDRAAVADLLPFDKDEAEAIAEARMNARAAAEAARREALESEAALAEWEAAKGDGTRTIFRRVAPPPAAPSSPEAEPVRRGHTEAELAELLRPQADAKPPRNIFLSATVYDGEVSEIRLWHEGERYEALSNVAFTHLQVIGSFEDETAHWSFFGMVESVDREKEARLAEEARALGAEYSPRIRPDGSLFTSTEVPEYVVLADRHESVPEEVLARLDAIHTYYLANERTLAIRHQRREALAEAHRKWPRENPEEPKDTIINFWRVD
ncbi:MAG: hypothetical protein ACLFRP_08815 [Puniceicoccaceae bacterium]